MDKSYIDRGTKAYMDMGVSINKYQGIFEHDGSGCSLEKKSLFLSLEKFKMLKSLILFTIMKQGQKQGEI